LITLTGDYFSYVIEGYEESLENSLKKLDAPYGKVGVLGNHDHWMSSDKIREIFKNSDIIDLSNDVITLEKDGDRINICGVDSCTVCADDLDKVIAKMPKNIPNILLAHEPDFAKESSQTNLFDLQISGHSHGGQFIIPKFETTPFRGPNSTKYPVGLYKVGNMTQYTSKGLGTNSFRVRINCKPEVTIITLKTTKKHKIEIE
jgi:predicted MPP superfamily phosphohydrolase